MNIDRDAAARYGLNIADVQAVVASAIGGDNIGETVEGLQRFPINVRYPREMRDSLEKHAQACRCVTERGAQLRARRRGRRSASATARRCCKSENARLSGWVYIDIRGRDLQLRRARHAAGGRAEGASCRRLLDLVVGPVRVSRARDRQAEGRRAGTLLIIFVLLYLTFRRFDEALLIMATLPFALVGGILAAVSAGHNMSVASAVGFIALAGVAAEFGVIMLLYLKHAWEARIGCRARPTTAELLDAIREGAVLRVRPKAMTVAVIIAGLLPIMWGAAPARR